MKKIISLSMCLVLLTTPVFASDTESDSGFFGFFDDALDFVSSTAAEAGKVTQDAIGIAGDALGELGTNISVQAGNTVSDLGNLLNEWGQGISEVAGQVSEAAASISQDIADKSVEIADQAMKTLNGAANVVVDSAGNIVNMASEGAAMVSSATLQALDIIAAQGTELVGLANDAIIGLDLTEPENVEKAKEAIDKAIEDAYDGGLIGRKLSIETIQIIKDVVFGTTVYGYQYANGIITLPEYSALMSEMIIKDGLPTGVGYVAGKLPIPGAGYIAKEVTTFLIQAAYGEGEEDVLFEDVE